MPEKTGDDAENSEFIPLILFIRETSHLDKVIGKEFEQKLGEHLGVKVPFARIGKYDGNVVFNRNTMTNENLQKLLTNGYEYEGQKVVFHMGTDKDRSEFIKNHGRHVGKIIEKSSIVKNRNWSQDGQVRERQP